MEKRVKEKKLKHFPLITAILLLGVMLFYVPFSSAFCFWWWCPNPSLTVVQPNSNDDVLQYSFHFWQLQKHFLNQTSNPNQTLDRIVATYDKNQLDYITGNQPLQFYIFYSALVKTWNINNPSYSVKYCNLTSRIWQEGANNPYYTTNITFQDVDYANAKAFFLLNDGDTIFIDMVCQFNGTQMPPQDQMPTTMQLITPTWKCKACQYYDWAIKEQRIRAIGTISDNTTQLVSFIKKIVFLNFEMWVILFWIFVILTFFLSIGLIFTGFYWIYEYLRKKIR